MLAAMCRNYHARHAGNAMQASGPSCSYVRREKQRTTREREKQIELLCIGSIKLA